MSESLFAHPMMYMAWSAALAFCACAAILWLLLRTGLAWRLAIDVPNERSLHERPIPRVGGWAMVPVVIVSTIAVAPRLWLVAACALCLAAVSQVDDRRGLPARVRFAAHLLGVAVVVLAYPAGLSWWMLAGVSFFLVWLVNLYNFMDGANGLAGGMAFFGFGGYAIAALTSSHPALDVACACAAIAGAAAGFLMFNFKPAHVFLGDAGSIPLGFLAGVVGYWGWVNGVWPIWFPPIIFAPFIGDATATLLRRLARGEKFWLPHREHYYQRMIRSGWSHTRMTLTWYVVMLAGTTLAVWALGHPASVQYGVALAWTVTLILMGAVVDLRWRRFRGRSGEIIN